MAEVRKMEEGMSEQDRRALVRAIRAEGRRGLDTQNVLNASLESVAQNNIQQIQADPVDLGPAQQALLASSVGNEVQGGQDYIEAQRAIFDQSRADRRAANNAYFDAVEGTQIPAVDYALQRYADALEADQAARAARARSRTGGRGGSGGGGGDEFAAEDGIAAPPLPDPSFISPTIAESYGVPDFSVEVDAVDAIFATIAEDPAADINVARRDAQAMLREAGLGQQLIDLLLADAVERWANYYTQNESRGRFEVGESRGRQGSRDPATFR